MGARPGGSSSAALAAGLALAAAACAQPTPGPDARPGTNDADRAAVDPPKAPRSAEPFATDWGRLEKLWRLGPGLEAGVEPVHFGARSSLHVCIVAGTYAPHRHASSDETVIIIEGHGALLLPGGKRVAIGSGQVLHIPAGASHGFEIQPSRATAADPEAGAIRALLVFSPPFKDGDQTPAADAPPGGPEPVIVDLDREAAAELRGGSTAPIVAREVARGPNASVNLVRATARLPLHLHAARAETVFVYQGEGSCRVGDAAGGETAWPAKPGAIFHIPETRPHAYEHQAILRGGIDGPPTRAISIFAPPFDGKDRVPVPDPKLAPPGPK